MIHMHLVETYKGIWWLYAWHPDAEGWRHIAILKDGIPDDYANTPKTPLNRIEQMEFAI